MNALFLALALLAGFSAVAAAMPCSDAPSRYREGGVNDATVSSRAARPLAQRRAAAPPRSSQATNVLPGLQTGVVAPRRAAARPIASPRDSASGVPSVR